MSKADKSPKFQIWLEEELYLRIRRVWPYGSRKAIIEKILEDVTILMEAGNNPEAIMGAIAKGDIKLVRVNRPSRGLQAEPQEHDPRRDTGANQGD